MVKSALLGPNLVCNEKGPSPPLPERFSKESATCVDLTVSPRGPALPSPPFGPGSPGSPCTREKRLRHPRLQTGWKRDSKPQRSR